MARLTNDEAADRQLDSSSPRNAGEYEEIAARATSADHEFWSTSAAVLLHWHFPASSATPCTPAWLASGGARSWSGWRADDGSPAFVEGELSPWSSTVDMTDAPFVRWFVGGRTNAAFNEVDRHVLAAPSERVAFASDTGVDRASESISAAALLTESVLAAWALEAAFGLTAGDRLALYLPNDLHAVIWMEAAKRRGAPYVAVAAATASRALADRLVDTDAALLLTNETLAGTAEEARQQLMATAARGTRGRTGGTGGTIQGVLVSREDTGALVGSTRAGARDLDAAPLPPPPLENWQWATAALLEARSRLLALGGLAMPPTSGHFVGMHWRLAGGRSVDVEASHPLFVLYTSGSTGKPKGIVHTHGGYPVGLMLTSHVVLNLGPTPSAAQKPEAPRDEAILVVATPGWITGQSYMIAAALLSRTRSVLLEGSPVAPPDRFAATIARHRVGVLKAGSTFLRMLMTRADAAGLLAAHDLSTLRLGSFCAEPVNEAVHRFAAVHLTPNYVNSYWATEHGGIVWSRCHANADQPRAPDTRTWPLPWIGGAVMVEDGPLGWHDASVGERGEVIILKHYPYQALTVWKSEGFGTATWRGDADRWRSYFSASIGAHGSGGGFVQGDTAVRHADGAYTFHGRSDEVINVGGIRIGTEEIENALLRSRPDVVANAAVVGVPHAILGTVPYAVIVPRPETLLTRSVQEQLRADVRSRLGAVSAPHCFLSLSELPETCERSPLSNANFASP